LDDNLSRFEIIPSHYGRRTRMKDGQTFSDNTYTTHMNSIALRVIMDKQSVMFRAVSRPKWPICTI